MYKFAHSYLVTDVSTGTLYNFIHYHILVYNVYFQDGRCNNLDNPHWGSADTHHLRYTRPEYDDGLGEPRLYSINGE